MTWTWQYVMAASIDVPTVEASPADVFPTQSDAETWLGEQWRGLRDQGVVAVTLFEGDRQVYGPMRLEV